MDWDTEGTHGSLCFSVLRVVSQSSMGPWVIYAANLVICTEFAFRTARAPLGSSEDRAGWWEHSKLLALARREAKYLGHALNRGRWDRHLHCLWTKFLRVRECSGPEKVITVL